MSTETADVIVAGAGPVGLTASLKLATLGWRVHLVERWPSAYGLPRAVGLDAESMRTFQSIGVADEQLAIGGTAGPYEWQNGEGQVLLLFPPRAARSGWPGVNICQPETEQLLERHVRSHPLITLTRGVEVVAIHEDADGVSVDLTNTRTAQPATPVRGQYIVGCDGAHSIVRDHMNTPMHDAGFYYDWYIIDVIPDHETRFGTDLLQVCSPQRPTTLVPSGPGRRRWEFMLLPSETKEQIDTEENAWRLLEPWDIHPGNAKIERRAVYTFQARWAETWNVGRALIAGDAAHLMPPFAAQGLNSGIRDVNNLSWKLDLVLNGTSPPALLDTYTTERSEHARHAIELSIELGKVICVLDPQQAAARDAALLPHAGNPDRAMPDVSGAEFHTGVIQYAAAGVPAEPGGTVAPQFDVRTSTATGRFDDVCGTGPTLLATPPLSLDEETSTRFAEIGGRIVLIQPPGTAVTRADEAEDLSHGYLDEFERLDAVAALHRPDGFYFGVAHTRENVSGLVDAFIRSVTNPAPENKAP